MTLKNHILLKIILAITPDWIIIFDPARSIMAISEAASQLLLRLQQVKYFTDLKAAFAVYEVDCPVIEQRLCCTKMILADQQVYWGVYQDGEHNILIGQLQILAAHQVELKKLPTETQQHRFRQQTQRIFKSQANKAQELSILGVFEEENMMLLHSIVRDISASLMCMMVAIKHLLQQRLPAQSVQSLMALLIYVKQISQQFYQTTQYLKCGSCPHLVKRALKINEI